MKHIIFLRHAQTEPFHLDGDHARNLTAYGKQQARYMAPHCAAIDGLKRVIVSDAVRTIQTSDIIFHDKNDRLDITISDSLYLAPMSDIFSVLTHSSDDDDNMMIIAHNPGLTDIIQHLVCSHELNKITSAIAPCTLVHMTADIKYWAELSPKSCQIAHYIIAE